MNKDFYVKQPPALCFIFRFPKRLFLQTDVNTDSMAPRKKVDKENSEASGRPSRQAGLAGKETSAAKVSKSNQTASAGKVSDARKASSANAVKKVGASTTGGQVATAVKAGSSKQSSQTAGQEVSGGQSSGCVVTTRPKRVREGVPLFYVKCRERHLS